MTLWRMMFDRPREIQCQTADPRLAVQILLAEQAHFEEAFRWNEETGERRVSLIFTLMTVAAAATGLVTNAADVGTETKLRAAAAVAGALLMLGFRHVGPPRP